MFPTINIGPFVFPTAGLIYILGAWISLNLVERAAKRLKLDPETTYGLAVTALFAGLVGARLVFVAIYWPAFQQNLLGIIWPLNTGYNLWGGLLIGGATAFFYGRAKQVPPASTLDALAPGLIAALIVVSLADFLAGPGFGAITRVPWGITLYGVRRHPVQIYEIVLGLAALLLWWRVAERRAFAAQPFLLTILLYSGGRLFLDTFRANAWLTSGGFHVVQIVSLVVMLGSLFLLARHSQMEQQQENPHGSARHF
jgi:phosphatidylglycerol:prolipoprotein diacylglycerol transferase